MAANARTEPPQGSGDFCRAGQDKPLRPPGPVRPDYRKIGPRLRSVPERARAAKTPLTPGRPRGPTLARPASWRPWPRPGRSPFEDHRQVLPAVSPDRRGTAPGRSRRHRTVRWPTRRIKPQRCRGKIDRKASLTQAGSSVVHDRARRWSADGSPTWPVQTGRNRSHCPSATNRFPAVRDRRLSTPAGPTAFAPSFAQPRGPPRFLRRSAMTPTTRARRSATSALAAGSALAESLCCLPGNEIHPTGPIRDPWPSHPIFPALSTTTATVHGRDGGERFGSAVGGRPPIGQRCGLARRARRTGRLGPGRRLPLAWATSPPSSLSLLVRHTVPVLFQRLDWTARNRHVLSCRWPNWKRHTGRRSRNELDESVIAAFGLAATRRPSTCQCCSGINPTGLVHPLPGQGDYFRGGTGSHLGVSRQASGASPRYPPPRRTYRTFENRRERRRAHLYEFRRPDGAAPTWLDPVRTTALRRTRCA